jgi:hypothetical protein
MEDGDVYYCTDVNHQPAFNHPLLKDHIIQVLLSRTIIHCFKLVPFHVLAHKLIICSAGTINVNYLEKHGNRS